VVDATGAGDALAAAMIIALLHGDSIDTALKLGLAAAALTCEAETSVSPAMSFNAIHNTW
jgi:pseudouridine kinase